MRSERDEQCSVLCEFAGCCVGVGVGVGGWGAVATAGEQHLRHQWEPAAADPQHLSLVPRTSHPLLTIDPVSWSEACNTLDHRVHCEHSARTSPSPCTLFPRPALLLLLLLRLFLCSSLVTTDKCVRISCLLVLFLFLLLLLRGERYADALLPLLCVLEKGSLVSKTICRPFGGH